MERFPNKFEAFSKGSPDRDFVYKFPSSLKEMLAKLTEVIYSDKKNKNSINYRFFLGEINNFVDNLQEYLRDVEFFENLGEGYKGENIPSQTVDMLNMLDNLRRDKHNALMLGYIRLGQEYQQYFKDNFPWPGIFFDKKGQIKKSLTKNTEEVDLSKITEEEREIFSNWALTMAKGLKKVKEIAFNSSEAPNDPEAQEAQEVKSYLKLLEAAQKLNQTSDINNEEKLDS